MLKKENLIINENENKRNFIIQVVLTLFLTILLVLSVSSIDLSDFFTLSFFGSGAFFGFIAFLLKLR
jgi:hypothetical protein